MSHVVGKKGSHGLDKPHTWRLEGCCIKDAKGLTAFFRSFDFEFLERLA